MELTVEKKYQLLLDISQRVRDTLDLDTILSLMLDTVYSVIPFDAAGIFVLNQDFVYRQEEERPQGMIAGIVLRGFEEHPVEEDAMLNLGQGIIGYVIRTRECVVVPDVRNDSRYVEGRTATLSEIAVPILHSDRAIGAVNLESDRLASFETNDVEVLQFFADAAAISIEKAMLHRRLIEKELLDQQLRLARKVQSLLFPRQAPQVKGYDIAGICIPTEHIGGDYFDFVPLEDNRLGIGVADVSGHGIAPALVMTAFRALLRTYARSREEPYEIASAINQLLPEFTGDRHFVTAIYAVLDPQKNEFIYSSCGHPHPLLLRCDGTLEILGDNGPALGIFEHVEYPACKAYLNPGDLLVLFTDGVVEITNHMGEQFRPEGLANLLSHGKDASAANLIQEIVRETKSFSGMESYQDDFTLVIIRANPAA